jgi:hypothetical protein
MAFWANMLVLSVQITDALAMVSQEPRTPTRGFSYVIRFISKARGQAVNLNYDLVEIVTSYWLCTPSGTAMTTKVMAIIKIFTNSIPHSIGVLEAKSKLIQKKKVKKHTVTNV